MKPKHMTAPRPCAAARQRPNWVLSERMVKRKPLIHMTLAGSASWCGRVFTLCGGMAAPAIRKRGASASLVAGLS